MGRGMRRILHLSDPHFGTEYEPAVPALLALASDLSPDVVVISGDITQRARRGQFAAARRFVQALQRPVLAVPGNHDLPLFNVLARAINPYGGYRRAMGPTLEPVIDMPGILAIGVNSTRPGRHVNGEVGAAQVERVAQRLRRADPDCLRMVVLHHPVRALEDSDQKNLLIGREAAVPAWVDAGVDLVLSGHIHLPYVLPLNGGAETDPSASSGTEVSSVGTMGNPRNTTAGSRRSWVVQAGTALSRRVRGGIPNSCYVIEHETQSGRHQCVVQRWDFSDEAGQFVQERQEVLSWVRA